MLRVHSISVDSGSPSRNTLMVTLSAERSPDAAGIFKLPCTAFQSFNFSFLFPHHPFASPPTLQVKFLQVLQVLSSTAHGPLQSMFLNSSSIQAFSVHLKKPMSRSPCLSPSTLRVLSPFFFSHAIIEYLYLQPCMYYIALQCSLFSIIFSHVSSIELKKNDHCSVSTEMPASRTSRNEGIALHWLAISCLYCLRLSYAHIVTQHLRIKQKLLSMTISDLETSSASQRSFNIIHHHINNIFCQYYLKDGLL